MGTTTADCFYQVDFSIKQVMIFIVIANTGDIMESDQPVYSCQNR
jgi:hypothetical protein